MRRILIVLLCLLTALGIASFILQGTPWLVLMVFLGATIGVPMGISYPFPLATKVPMVFGLVVSVIAIYLGFRNHSKLYGQILAIIGIIVWCFIGIIGLGTGT